ncbi:glycosyltransferase [Candidatus Avelusimicrobium fimicolum]|uniref:glycosyltransferase n=1 Tax=Candidatus Avelusimicrobium fimicolum TaxID=3416216 RepID=UPI003D09887F
MSYTAEDIEVFFFAHDRGEFLRQALDCYLNQTVKGARLVILANAPTEKVLQVAKEYASKGVELVHEPKPLNVYGCTQYCQEAASRAITVMAHDDDLIHPAYLETILKSYNQIPELNVAISAMGDWDERLFSNCNTKAAVLQNISEFSAYIFLGGSFTFSSASYRTETLKKAPKPNFEQYGKIQDVPFMLRACMDGKATVLQFPFIKYRIHSGQDCQTFSTGPTAEQWFELDGLHKKLMNEGGSRLRLAWKLNAYHRLRIGWRDWCLCEHGKMKFSEYIAHARGKGLLENWADVFGFIVRGATRQRLLKVIFTPQKMIL